MRWPRASAPWTLAPPAQQHQQHELQVRPPHVLPPVAAVQPSRLLAVPSAPHTGRAAQQSTLLQLLGRALALEGHYRAMHERIRPAPWEKTRTYPPYQAGALHCRANARAGSEA